MVSVREVIVEAFRNAGVIQDGEPLDGTKTVTGETLLNDVIAQMTLENFFASQTILVRGHGNGKTEMTIGPVQYWTRDDRDPVRDQWLIDNTLTEPNDATHVRPEYPYRKDREYQPDIEADRPANILQLYCGGQEEVMAGRLTQVALADVPLFQVNYGAGFPARFAYQSSYPLGKLVFDLPLASSWSFCVCYSKALPPVKINDMIPVSGEYKPALTWMLAEQLTTRYMLPNDVQERVSRMRDRYVGSIKNNTDLKTPIHAYYNDSFANTILNRF